MPPFFDTHARLFPLPSTVHLPPVLPHTRGPNELQKPTHWAIDGGWWGGRGCDVDTDIDGINQVDIIHRYNADEARNLKQYGELPEHARINETAVDLAMEGDGAEDDIGIDFDDI